MPRTATGAQHRPHLLAAGAAGRVGHGVLDIVGAACLGLALHKVLPVDLRLRAALLDLAALLVAPGDGGWNC